MTDNVTYHGPERPKRLHSRGQPVFAALIEAGIIRENDYVRRVVIDIDISTSSGVVIHVERYGDERLLEVIRGLDGVEIHCEPRVDHE